MCREPGPYADDDLQNDFDGYRYFKRREMASIKDLDGSKYLDVKLHDGCVGTVGSKGCGLQGALPLFNMGDSATLEYMCASRQWTALMFQMGFLLLPGAQHHNAFTQQISLVMGFLDIDPTSMN